MLFLSLIFCLFSAKLSAQDIPITLNLKDVKLEQALEAIEKQTNYLFVYEDKLDVGRVVSITAESKPLKSVLNELLSGNGIQYTISNTSIVLSPAKTEADTSSGRRITGKVTGEDGKPISGATINIKGTSQMAVSGNTGQFTMEIPASAANAMLTVSCIGYAPREVPIGGRTNFDIAMTERSIDVDAVVVTALGIKRSEKALSYNVQQVGSDDIVGVKDANFINSLNGKVAGLNINASSSGIGGASKVSMRGVRSVQGSSNALYVIDGVPMLNDNRETGSISDSPFSSSGTTDMVADLNPEDIESISVLTGAAAAALYGSSAANGAIIINTKKGFVDATTLTITQNTEFSSAFVTPKFQNRYGTSLTEDQRNRSWGNLLNQYDYVGYRPTKDYFQTGITTTETVALSTGSAKNQTYFSIGALNSEGIIPNNKYDRYNLNIRNTAKLLKDKMTFESGASYIRQRDLNMTNQGVYSNPLASAYLYPRGNDWNNVQMFERFDDQRLIATQFWDMDAGEYVLQNPYWINYRNLRENKKDRFMANASLNYKVLDWLTLSGRANIDTSEDKGTRKIFATSDTQLTESSRNGLYAETSMNNRLIYADVLANAQKSFGRDWNLNVIIGASITDTYSDYREVYGPIRDGSIEGEVALIPNVFSLYQLSPSKTKRSLSGYHDQMQSVYGSAEVGYKSTYYLTATLRTDWPSLLGGVKSNQKSFTYPSVGLSVVASEMIKMPKQISYLKFRGSYANVGIAPPRFLTRPTQRWVSPPDEWLPNTYKAFDHIKPEKTHSFEAGLTARFLKHFNVDLSFYHTNSVDQVLNPRISPGSGYTSTYIQNGNVRNRGVELSAGYSNRWNKFAWQSNVVFSANQNKIIKLGGVIVNEDTGESTPFSYLSMGGLGNSLKFLLQEGGTLGDLYSSIDLVRDHNGKVYVDNNGQIEIDASNKTPDKWVKLGSVLPKANLSWRNDFTYGRLNFGFILAARIGGIAYSRTQATLDYHGVSKASADARDRGGVMVNGGDVITAENWYSVVGNADGLPSYYTYDATNVRLQEASISYAIPKKWLGNVCDMTVSLVGRNLLMLYNKAPFDPESTASVNDNYYQGIDYFMMPSLRNLGFSVRVTF